MSDAPLNHPASLSELFWAFNRLALQGFGGVLAVAQRELVERLRWLSREEFLEVFAVAQVLPGPNILNLSLMLGDRFFGIRGAFTAMAGMLLFPLMIVIGMAALYGQMADHPIVANTVRGMGAVSAGLIVATALKLMPSLRRSPMGAWPALGLAVLTLIGVLWLRLPLPQLLLGLGGLGMALAGWQLYRADRNSEAPKQ